MKRDNDLKIILYIILFLLSGIIIITCKPKSGDYIMTVTGPVQSGEMGLTLVHEHILVDFIGADSINSSRWNREEVIAKALPVILKVKDKGLKTIIDCTPSFLGRDPLLLKELSQKAGLNIITNTGYYGAFKNRYIPKSFFSTDASQLAKLWIEEFENGIEGTGIKPGFIKIAVDPDDTLSADHMKIITAAGIAHLKTGLTIASHTGPDKPAFDQINVLKQLGVDPSAFIWIHAQKGTDEGIIKAAQEGTWISFDNVRERADFQPGSPNSIDWYADRILELKKNSLLNRLLLSHDSGWYDPAKPEGGNFNGYTDLFEFLLPALKKRGFTQSEIDQILIKNPAEAFKIRIRKL
jgi:phosphotriesterase-related protein